ncbi:WD40 repeat-like protein [Aspergillus violaceofuscus CBS 115571]|uniref:WD40 repeat-like protein n=1 Tax=Aspergillus violaceofuscus (strain CBS 115571) TaxID=1450538 RepID=A0A2V5H389_ASPV1|nr:WD40 repeat-like protein [Aspergillus violaceofuscus CBS 115571]
MKLSNQSEVPVYTISGSNTARELPEWLARRRKRSLKNDPEWANRVELLQDFGFEEASRCIRVSEDGDWVMSTGTYKPQMHVHSLQALSLSYARHTDVENTTFLLLSSDYSKSLHLQSDRSLEFHTPSGMHHKTRLPRYGRDLVYDRQTTEALVPAVGVNSDGMGEVFRLNLEMGRYMRSFEVDVGGDDFTSAGGGTLQGGINTGAVNTGAIAEESHNLLAFGTSNGTVEFFDPRARSRIGTLVSPAHGPDESRQEITALEFHRSGLTLGTGSSNGLIFLYDLRMSRPMLKKDQGYGFPIHTLKFLQPSTASREQTLEPKILSADKKIIKIWDPRDGSPWTSVEPAVDINSVAWCKDSGMLLTANEGPLQHSFLIPQLGPSPRWCSFLDNLVEEMAEDPNDPNAFNPSQAGSVYDNYKFLTVPQLKTLNLDHLIGRTSLLRPYMHGYFVAQQLYEEARLITNPYMWEEERAKRVREKIEKERESRIRGKKKAAVKVNQRLAEKLLSIEEKNERKRAQRVLKRGGDDDMVDAPAAAAAAATTTTTDEADKNPLGDSRFAKLFEDEDFAIDETSREFQLLNPSTAVEAPPRKERGLTAVEQEMVDDVRGSSDSSDSESDGGQYKSKPAASNKISTASYRRNKQGRNQEAPRMEISSSTNVSSTRDRSFGSRAQNMRTRDKPSRRGGVVGEREVTFTPGAGRQQGKRSFNRPEQQSTSSHNFRAKERRSASGNTFRKM